jgi:hypothetical protein
MVKRKHIVSKNCGTFYECWDCGNINSFSVKCDICYEKLEKICQCGYLYVDLPKITSSSMKKSIGSSK